MAKNDPRQLLISAGARALVPAGELLVVPGVAETDPDENSCHLLADVHAQTLPGARALAGWSLERLKRQGTKGHYALFDYHSVVRLADGTLVCPSTPRGQHIQFVADPARPYDPAQRVARNLAVFSSCRLEGKRGTVALPFTLTWAAPFGDGYLYAVDDRRSQWVAFGWHDAFAFVAGRGLNPGRLEDVAFCSDIDTLAESLGLQLGVNDDAEVLAVARRVMQALHTA